MIKLRAFCIYMYICLILAEFTRHNQLFLNILLIKHLTKYENFKILVCSDYHDNRCVTDLRTRVVQ